MTIGTVSLRRHDDGTVTVDHADDLIVVAAELVDNDPEGRPVSTITLDTAGHYQYERTDLTPPRPGSIVFRRLA